MNRDQPYNDLPLLPPAAELETPAVLKKAIAANRRLAELKGHYLRVSQIWLWNDTLPKRNYYES